MDVFIAKEALATSPHTVWPVDHRRVLPGVYAPKTMPLSFEDRTTAAWLWSQCRGVITGLAASALHKAKWVDPNTSIELNLAHNKSPSGVITRRETLLDSEVVQMRGTAMTSTERTAFDLARQARSIGPSSDWMRWPERHDSRSQMCLR